MTKEELKQWRIGTRIVDGDGQYDSNGTHEGFLIIEKDRLLYRLWVVDGEPTPKWDDKRGYAENNYELELVERKVEMVENVYYLSQEELEESQKIVAEYE